jgi:hypothetical protein
MLFRRSGNPFFQHHDFFFCSGFLGFALQYLKRLFDGLVRQAKLKSRWMIPTHYGTRPLRGENPLDLYLYLLSMPLALIRQFLATCLH